MQVVAPPWMNLDADSNCLTNDKKYVFGGTPWTLESKSTNLLTLTGEPGEAGFFRSFTPPVGP